MHDKEIKTYIVKQFDVIRITAFKKSKMQEDYL